MEQNHIKSYEGSPQSSDIFQPHMPGVDLLSDMDALFDQARSQLQRGELPIENLEDNQRTIAVVTPGRMIMYQPCPSPGSMSPESVEPITQLMPASPPLNISVITYTFLEAMMKDMNRCIPFLGYLMAFGYVGHSVVAFEGHSSAYQSGVRNSDVLLVDSGMVPFLQSDWVAVAEKVMRPGARMYIHDRENYTLGQIVKATAPESRQQSKPWWKVWK